MGLECSVFNRTTLLLGSETMSRMAEAKVILFGVGGVGSWCAEGLVRSGIKHLTIVDSDRVSVTNINRQLMATTKTVGEVKVDAMRDHLLAINPEANIITVQKIFCKVTAESFNLDDYDYIIDCIDSLKDKILLILRATQTKAKFYSSMGAALKIDPTRIRVAEFWKVNGCPLARMIRKRMKQAKTFPAHKFLCVYSDELLENRGLASVCEPADSPFATNEGIPGDASLAYHDWNASKAQINGTVMHITAIFGLTLSGLIIQDIVAKGPDLP